MMEPPEGLKARHGDFYQLKLLLLFLKEAIKMQKNEKNFSLTTENKGLGRAFDDVIFGWQKEDGTYTYRLLQAKHKTHGELSCNDFFSTNKKDNSFSIFKYCASYCAIRQSADFPQIRDFILCTNSKIDKRVVNNNPLDKGIDVIERVDEMFENILKIHYDMDSKNLNLIKRLEKSIDLSALANALAECILPDSALDTKSDILKMYHIPLFAEIIELNSDGARFKKNFIRDANSLTESAKELRNNLLKICNLDKLTLKLSDEFKNQKLEDFMITSDQIAEFNEISKRKKKFYKQYVIEQETIVGERFSSNLPKLIFDEISQKLVDCVINNTEITFKSAFKDYYRQIIKEIINVGEKKFHTFFINKEHVSETAKKLRDAIVDKLENPQSKNYSVLQKTMKVTNGFRNVFKLPTEELSNGEIEKLAEYFKALISGTPLSVEYRIIQKLAGHVIVYDESSSCKKMLRFKSAFFDDQPLRSDLEKLKEMLANEIDKLKAPFTFPYENFQNSDEEIDNDELKILKDEMIPCLLKRGDFLNNETINKLIPRVLIKDNTDENYFKINPEFINKQQERNDLKTLRKNIRVAANFNDEILKDCRINIVCYHTCFERQWHYLPTKDDISKIIEEFCRDFGLAVGQPIEKKLNEKIEKEFGKIFLLEDASIYAENMYHTIVEWVQEVNAQPLTKQTLKKHIVQLESQICNTMVRGISAEYCKSFENIEYESTCEGIENVKSFLSSPTDVVCFVEAKNSTFKSAVQAYQACIEPMPENINEDNPDTAMVPKSFLNEDSKIFMSIDHKMKDEILKAFMSEKSHHLLVVVVDNDKKIFMDEKNERFLEKVFDFVNNENPKKKKLLLISPNNENFFENFISKYSKNSIKFCDLSSDFDDIKDVSLFKTRKIKFQSDNALSIESFNEYCGDILRSLPLHELITTIDPLIIGKKLEKPEKYCKYYSQRRFYHPEVVDKKILLDEDMRHIFAVEGITKADFGKLGLKKDMIYDETEKSFMFYALKSSIDAYKQIYILQRKYEKRNVRWLKFQNSSLIEMKPYSEDEFVDQISKKKIVIITDMAGMGKSTSMHSLALSFKEKYPHFWVIRINFNKYTELLKTAKETNERNVINIMKEKEVYSNDIKEYEKVLFRKLEELGQVLLIFDGFDEINSNYGATVIEGFHEFYTTNKSQIWITSRKEFKIKLEEAFNVKTSFFEPLGQNDQINYLIKYWNIVLNEVDVGEEKSIIYAKFLIKKLKNEIEDNLSEFLGIPLQLNILAEAVKKRNGLISTEKWDGLEEFLSADKKIPHIPKLNLFNLFNTFISSKIESHLKDKMGVKMSASDSKDLKTFWQGPQYTIHSYFGFNLLMNGNPKLLAELITDEDNEKMKTWREHIQSGIGDIGVINGFSDGGNAYFIHLTFAEYFAALFIVEKMFVKKTNLIFEAMDSILPKVTPIFLKCVIGFIQNDKENFKKIINLVENEPLISYAIKHYYSNVYKALLGEHWAFPENIANKTPIHYAVQYGNISAFGTFCEHIFVTIYNELHQNYKNRIKLLEIISHFEFFHKMFDGIDFHLQGCFHILLKFINIPDKHGKSALVYKDPLGNYIVKGLIELEYPFFDDSEMINTVFSTSYAMLRSYDPYYYAHIIYFSIREKKFEFSNILLQNASTFGFLVYTLQMNITSNKLWNVILYVFSKTSLKWMKNLLEFIDQETNLKCETLHVEFINFKKIIIKEGIIFSIKAGNLEMFGFLLAFDVGSDYSLYFSKACYLCQKEIAKYIKSKYFGKIEFLLTALSSETSNELLDQCFTQSQIQSFLDEYATDGIKNKLMNSIEKNKETIKNVEQWLINIRNIKYLERKNMNLKGIFGKKIIELALKWQRRDTIDYVLKVCGQREINIKSKFIQNGLCINGDIKAANNSIVFNDVTVNEINAQKSMLIFYLEEKENNVENIRNHLLGFCKNNITALVKICFSFGAVFEEEMLEHARGVKTISFLKDVQNCLRLNIDMKNFQQKGEARKARNKKRQTMLHMFIEKNELDVLYYYNWDFLKTSYDMINAVDENGNTALHIASQKGMVNVVFMLLENGAMYDVINETTGKTPKNLAEEALEKITNHDHEIKETYAEIINAYVEIISAFTDIENGFKYVESNDVKLLKEFLKCNSRFCNLRNNDKKTFFHVATKIENFECMNALFSETDNFKNSYTEYNTTHFIESFWLPLPEALSMYDKDNKTPLCYSVENNSLKTVIYLLKKGACCTSSSSNEFNNSCTKFISKIEKLFDSVNSETPHVVPSLLDSITVKYDLEYKHILKFCDKYQKTLLHYIEKGQNKRIIKFLKENGLDNSDAYW